MQRFRPFRVNAQVRDAYAEVPALTADNFIYPYFIEEGRGKVTKIASLPGVNRFSIDTALEDIARSVECGIKSILLFGIVAPEHKDEYGTAAYCDHNLISEAVSAIKAKFPKLTVITDVCLCEYTSHGHCGLLHDHDVDNDATLPLLAKEAVAHAKAGADIVAPSAMMDGQVAAIRQALDEAGLKRTQIMGYSAKYASAFYGPFRDAAESAPSFGDRRSYQMDYRTLFQGLEEIKADIDEGADFIMVKPALAYLDMIARAKALFPRQKLTAYQVSGEYAMLKAGAKLGYFDEKRIFEESLTAIRRAGAELIISYYARDYLEQLKH